MSETELRTENAVIASTSFGKEDHGVLTFVIALRGDCWGCGFGCLRSDGPGLAQAIITILNTLEVDSWEKLKGQYVRTKTEGYGGSVKAIGHLIKDRWVTIEELSELIKGGKL